MKSLKKRYKTMAVLGAALSVITTALPATGGHTVAAAPPPFKDIGTLTIRGSMNTTRRILEPAPVDAGKLIDACLGAVVIVTQGSTPGVRHLGAHRTTCKNGTGFGGVENLKPGDTISWWDRATGKTTTYEWFAESITVRSSGVLPAPIGTQVTLQTSKDSQSREVYLEHFRPVGIPRPAGNRGQKVTQGRPACVAIPGAVKDAWVFANVTPVGGEGRGYLTAYPAGRNTIVPDPNRAPTTSTANWTSAAASPNTTLVQAGDSGKVCVATYVGAAHITIDALAVAAKDKFTAAQRRLIDTRSNGGTVNNSSRCFQVPGGSGKWTVFNVTAIGRGTGWGRIETSGSTRTYSNVNFKSGDVDSNMAILKVPTSETVCYRSNGSSDAVVDLIAFAKSGTFREDPRLPGRIPAGFTTPSYLVPKFYASSFGGSGRGWAFINSSPLPVGMGSARLYDCQVHPTTGSDVNYTSRADPNVGVIATGPNTELCMSTTGARPGWVFDALAIADSATFKTPNIRRIYDSRL